MVLGPFGQQAQQPPGHGTTLPTEHGAWEARIDVKSILADLLKVQLRMQQDRIIGPAHPVTRSAAEARVLFFPQVGVT